MRLLALMLAATVLTPCARAAQPTETKALFREGQTFLSWKEDAAAKGETYRVYRHTEKITADNLAQARLVAEVREGSSRFEEMWTSGGKGLLGSDKGQPPAQVIPRLCVEPVGEDNVPKMLAEDVGLFVWTVKEPECRSFYAVTAVVNGAEDKTVGDGNSCGPVAEKKEPIGAVRYYVQKGDKGDRDWYIMWMDYELWNPDYIGYAFPFAITCSAFKEGGAMPSAHLDGIGTMSVFTAGYTNYGCGDFSKNALPTWYFGYGTKVRDRASGMDVKQPVANYVQYRIMQTVLWARRRYRITDPRFHINGNSMGASGAMGFAIAFPRFVTSIWANEGITDYANPGKNGRGDVMWAGSMWGNYGKPELANPVKPLPFGEAQLDWYLKHDGISVFDFRNVAGFLEKNVDVSFPYLNIGHCHQDGSIIAAAQAYPFEKRIANSRQTFCYTIAAGGHGWGSAWGNGGMSKFVSWDQSRPGFSGVPSVMGWRYDKCDKTSRTYMYKAAWGARGRKIGGKDIPVVDTETEWSMPLIHEAKEGQEQDYFVDVTPRNLQKLQVAEGDVFTWQITALDGKPLEIADFAAYANGPDVKDRFKNAGEIVADRHNLLLVPDVPIRRSGCIVGVKLKARGPKFKG